MTGPCLRLLALALAILSLSSCGGDDNEEFPAEDRVLGTWRHQGDGGTHIIEFQWGGTWASRLQPDEVKPGIERLCQAEKGLWKIREDGVFLIGSKQNGKGAILYNAFRIEELNLGNLHLRTAMDDGSEEFVIKYSRIGEIPDKLKTDSLNEAE